MRAWVPFGLLLALGCATPQVYDWGGYDKHMYNLMRDPKALEAYGLALKAQIDRNPDGRRVPPGIYAEYGYVLYCAGNKAEARGFFIREKTRWPESAKLMDRMIANCTPPPPEAGPAPVNPLPAATPTPVDPPPTAIPAPAKENP